MILDAGERLLLLEVLVSDNVELLFCGERLLFLVNGGEALPLLVGVLKNGGTFVGDVAICICGGGLVPFMWVPAIGGVVGFLLVL